MRPLNTYAALAALALASAVGSVRAAGFSAKDVPADAKWVVHVDVDAVRATKAWTIINEKLQDNIDAQLKFQQVEDFTGVRFPDDIHDVTLYGESFVGNAPVILMHLDIDRVRIRNMLANAQNFSTTTHNGREVLSWEDKGKQIYATFVTDTYIALGQSADKVDAALDAIDGKVDTLAQNTLMKGPANAGVLLYAGSDALAALQQQQGKSTPVLNQMHAGWVAVSERGADLVVQAVVQAASADAARQMLQSVEGIKAMLALASSGANADPKLAMIAGALTNLTVAADGAQVRAEWPVKETTVQQFVEQQMAAKHAPGQAPAASQTKPAE